MKKSEPTTDFKPQKGLESFKQAVITDCTSGENCFNLNGCDHVGRSKCTHRPCDKYKWVIERATQYAEKLNVPMEQILEGWETQRTYWHQNFYQDANQPDISKCHVVTLEAWKAELVKRFGEDKSNWKFKCPSCGHVQSFSDFESIGQDGNLSYINCIGRYIKNTGCDWSINGLFAINTTTVIDQELQLHKVFEIADQIDDSKIEIMIPIPDNK